MRWAWRLVLAWLICWPAQALADWREVTTDHFIVYSEEAPQAVVAYAEKLELYDRMLRHMLDMRNEAPAKSGKLTVFVLPSEAAIRSMYGKGGDSVGGFYLPRARGAIAFVPRPTRVKGENGWSGQLILLHEYAHHFMLSNFSAAYPSWYVEGFAEFCATTVFEDDGSLVVGRPPQFRAYEILAPTALTVEEMVQTGRKYSTVELSQLYGRGWLLTHYLNFTPARDGQLAKYLTGLNTGTPSLQAAQAAFGDLRQMDRDLRAYAAGKLAAGRLTLPPVKASDVKVRELTAGENATMPVRMRSTRGVSLDEARKLLPDARRAAGRFPNDAMAQRVLAEAEFDAGNLAEAEAAADRALAADPTLTEAMIYKGMVRQAQAIATNDPNSPLWREARRLFLQANRLDSTHPEPLIHFYTSFPTAPTANAVTGLIAAFRAAPHDRGVRLMLARQQLIEGKTKDARRLLLPLAFAPHEGGAKNLAQQVVEGIDQGKSGPDLAAMLLGAQPDGEGEGKPALRRPHA
ncbi:hypothetical protein [Phenylobacterium deserti]|uniref:DUF1570 domain-containing protein n=1 Tax=Phenylobacterium deserti TaxID=1914756 RepID=A0A328AAG0_9CAUL|nr:hypothetical protein [Phenylobacterium deserti]RAK51417.1 hypothetical protein DJ018_15885 [Phenylobacterium deserti]